MVEVEQKKQGLALIGGFLHQVVETSPLIYSVERSLPLLSTFITRKIEHASAGRVRRTSNWLLNRERRPRKSCRKIKCMFFSSSLRRRLRFSFVSH